MFGYLKRVGLRPSLRLAKRFSSSTAFPVSALSSREFRKFPLLSRRPAGSGNAFVFTFATGGAVIPPGRHLLARAIQPNGDVIQQPYTPVSSYNASNIELLVRLYADGKMSGHLSSMKDGDNLDLLGPVGSYEFKPNTNDEVFMVAGGSGITPIYAILNYIFKSEPKVDLTTKFELLYANRVPENILLRQELDALAREFPDRFKVVYVVDEIPKSSEGDSSLRLLKNWRSTMAQFPGRKPSKNAQILVCGPPVMETAVAQLFRESGVDERRIRTFTKAGMAEPNPAPIAVNKKYTMDQVKLHSSPEDAWLVIGDQVYDVTKFISEHPGGDIIMDGVGKDATDLFENEFSHSDDAKRLLASFQIGFLNR